MRKQVTTTTMIALTLQSKEAIEFCLMSVKMRLCSAACCFFNDDGGSSLNPHIQLYNLRHLVSVRHRKDGKKRNGPQKIDLICKKSELIKPTYRQAKKTVLTFRLRFLSFCVMFFVSFIIFIVCQIRFLQIISGPPSHSMQLTNQKL